MDSSDDKINLKIILVGPSGVGKSAILRRFAENTFHVNNESTLGLDFRIKELFIDNKTVKCHIWDTAGQERFATVVNSYYRGAHAILLIFDPHDVSSLDDLIKRFVGNESVKEAMKMGVYTAFVATKTDLGLDIDEQNILKKLEPYESSLFWTSAKDNSDIETLFTTAATYCIRNKVIKLTKENDGISLKVKRPDENKGYSCC